jgi:hypothetical protein
LVRRKNPNQLRPGGTPLQLTCNYHYKGKMLFLKPPSIYAKIYLNELFNSLPDMQLYSIKTLFTIICDRSYCKKKYMLLQLPLLILQLQVCFLQQAQENTPMNIYLL